MDNKVINSKIDFKNCDKRPMLLKTRKGHHEPWWRCTKCTSWMSIRFGSYFEENRIALSSILKLIHCYMNDLTISSAVETTGVFYSTVQEYYEKFRYVCAKDIKIDDIKLGGKHKEVEIDESMFAKVKHHRGKKT